MGMVPFFTMSRKQIGALIAKSSPEEGERIRKILEHSVSRYDLVGNHIPHEFEKENVLEIIRQRDAYVIDNNSSWKSECESNLEKAFIISPPLSREHPDTKNLILDKSRAKLGNIFSVGVDMRLPNCVLVERIDEPFRHAFDIPRLTEASKGKGATVAKQKAAIWGIIEHEKQRIRFIIEVHKAADLPSPSRLQVKINVFKSEIMRLLPECRYHLAKSQKLAWLCYATLLMEDEQPRKDEGPRFEFDMPNYENVFGDMHIVQTAIYLGAKILTKDKPLTKMASYAGIDCCHVPKN